MTRRELDAIANRLALIVGSQETVKVSTVVDAVAQGIEVEDSDAARYFRESFDRRASQSLLFTDAA